MVKDQKLLPMGLVPNQVGIKVLVSFRDGMIPAKVVKDDASQCHYLVHSDHPEKHLCHYLKCRWSDLKGFTVI